MSTGSKSKRFSGMLVLCAAIFGFLVLGSLSVALADSTHSQHKTKKQQFPPLPSGPTGPVQQVPLDSIAPVLPQVTYENEQLTIVAPNSTLADILRAVRKQTGADIEIPVAPERVVTHLGPGPARDVLAELLNGSRFNYVLVGSPANDAALTRVVLVAKTAPEIGSPNNRGAEQPGMAQAGNMTPAQTQMATDTNDAADAEETTTDDAAADQAAAEAEQQIAAPDQPSVKTPQQLLQEMQQRQLQFQQQQQQMQQPTQAPIPSSPPQAPQ